MYVPKNRDDLYAAMAVYIGYAPDLSTYRYFANQEDAEAELDTRNNRGFGAVIGRVAGIAARATT